MEEEGHSCDVITQIKPDFLPWRELACGGEFEIVLQSRDVEGDLQNFPPHPHMLK